MRPESEITKIGRTVPLLASMALIVGVPFFTLFGQSLWQRNQAKDYIIGLKPLMAQSEQTLSAGRAVWNRDFSSMTPVVLTEETDFTKMKEDLAVMKQEASDMRLRMAETVTEFKKLNPPSDARDIHRTAVKYYETGEADLRDLEMAISHFEREVVAEERMAQVIKRANEVDRQLRLDALRQRDELLQTEITSFEAMQEPAVLQGSHEHQVGWLNTMLMIFRETTAAELTFDEARMERAQTRIDDLRCAGLTQFQYDLDRVRSEAITGDKVRTVELRDEVDRGLEYLKAKYKL